MAATELTLEVTRDLLPDLRAELHCWLAEAGTPERDRGGIVLACWEAAMNAIEHPVAADGQVRLDAERRRDHIVVSVADNGTWRSYGDQVRHDRGLGLKLIAALMDRVQVVQTESGTRVLMCRCLAPRCH